MKKYFIEMYAIVKAKNKQEADNIAGEIVNVSLPSKIEKKVETIGYDDGFGAETIREYKEEM